jgi:hypothetical protein
MSYFPPSSQVFSRAGHSLALCVIAVLQNGQQKASFLFEKKKTRVSLNSMQNPKTTREVQEQEFPPTLASYKENICPRSPKQQTQLYCTLPRLPSECMSLKSLFLKHLVQKRACNGKFHLYSIEM